MDCGHGKMRMNVEGDRISSLPDDLIHKILSFIGIKQSIQTSALSSRWRFIWTSMPYLNFSSEDFDTLPKFSKFVTHVLSWRSNQVEVSSVKLSFRGKVNQVFVKRILNYSFSHNVQQLIVTRGFDIVEFPLSLFSSHSLKHFTMAGRNYVHSIKATSTWELPALTTLYLDYITFDDVITDNCIGLLSKCPNLKNLTLNHCSVTESDDVNLCHPGLSNLTLENGEFFENVLNVVAPHLKNLIIREWPRVHVVSAPEVAYLLLKGSHGLQCSPYSLCSLEKVHICIYKPCYQYKLDKTDAHKIVGLLQRLHNAKFLTLNLEIIELLSSCVELISHQPTPFSNLKSLKVYPHDAFSKVQETIPTEVKKYLLDSSPGATVTMVSCEEIRALKNATSAQNHMAKLQVLLEQEKANCERNRVHLDQGKVPMENHKQRTAQPVEKMQVDKSGRMMSHIESCWKDLIVQIEQGKAKTRAIISKLQDIEPFMTELPASKRDKIQACYSSLCAEADTVMSKIMDCMKIKCDENQSDLSVCFHQLAKASQPS